VNEDDDDEQTRTNSHAFLNRVYLKMLITVATFYKAVNTN
jgi:hypothetical protein